MWQMLLMFVVTTVLGELLRPRPKINAPKPSALGEFQFPTAEYGRAVPVAFGECHIKGPNVTWFGDLRVDAITEEIDTGWFSSETVTKGYEYSMGAQLVFCKGFSAWELQNGSGLVELRFDDKRPTALTVAATEPASATTQVSTSSGMFQTVVGSTTVRPPLIFTSLQATAARAEYSQTSIGDDPESRFTRVTIRDDELYGGIEKEGGVRGTIDFHFGQAGAVRNDYLQRVFETQDIPAYRGYCHAVLRQCYIGTTSYPKPVSAVVRRYPWFWNTSEGWQVGYDANPIAMVVDLLTNGDYGCGVPLDQIGASFQTAALACFNEGLGLSMLFDNQSPAKDLIAEVLRHVDGVMYTDPATGLYELTLARDDYDAADLLTLYPDNVVSLEMTRPSWSETQNIVKINYLSAEAGYTPAVLTQQNQSNIAVRGGVRAEESFDFRGISSVANANKIAARVLRTLSHPLARFQLTATRAAHALRPGSVFSLSWPELGITDLICRVTRISYGSLTEPHITLEAVEDIFGVLDTQFTAPPESTWQSPVAALNVNAAEALIEAPFHLAGKEARQVMTLASRSSSQALGYKVQSSPDGVPVITATVPKFTPSGRLVADYSGSTAAIDADGFELYACIDCERVTSITDSQRLAGWNLLQVDDELMTFTTITPTPGGFHLGGVVRGVLDTLPTAHQAGARVWFVSHGAGLVQSAPYSSDRTITAKLLPYDGSRTLDAEAAATLSVMIASRALKPYTPGRLRVATVGRDLVFSWAHRPRRQMLADDRIPDRDYDGYAACEGTYTVAVLVGGQVKRTLTGLTGKQLVYTAAERLADDADATKPVSFRITAVEGGHSSAVQETEPLVL